MPKCKAQYKQNSGPDLCGMIFDGVKQKPESDSNCAQSLGLCVEGQVFYMLRESRNATM